MNRIHLAFILLLFCTVGFKAQEKKDAKQAGLTWHTDMVKAAGISEKTKKPIFAMFTGSDWCGWCKKLQNDVFAKPEFVKWAEKNVVLMEVDFPRFKQLSPELTQQNNSLQQTFGVQGYPTIWMFYMAKDAKTQNYGITPLGSLGYPQGATGGKEEVKFLDDANALLKKNNKK